MGVSNDSILAFGFSLEEDRPDCLDDDEGSSYETFDDMVIAKSGLKEPNDNTEYEHNATSPEWVEYYKKVNEIKATCPVEMHWFCSYEYPMYFISLKGTEKKASRGYVEEVNTDKIAEQAIEKFKQFCESYNIEWQTPKWYIFGMNG